MHTRCIGEKLKRVLPGWSGTAGFVPAAASMTAVIRPRDPFAYAGTDPTHELADLTRDIEANWNYIEPNLKECIRQYFVVTETKTGVDVSLL
jgi:hypothetical protein